MTNRKNFLVPDVMGRAGLDHLRARDDVETVVYPAGITTGELHTLLQEADGVALWATAYRQAELDASPRIEVVARLGVGYDAVEVPALTARGVPLMVTGTANSVSVAEHATFLIFALAKLGSRMDRLVREGKWSEKFDDMPIEIAGKALLVVGFGRIGTRMAKRAAALDMNVRVYDPYVASDVITAAGYEAASDLDAAVATADFVTIHCPRSPATIGLFDGARIARMKRGAYLINTARGGIVDEPALHSALTAGHLAGAGLDVFAEEPTPASNPLLQLSNVVAAPHVAGSTRESTQAMALEAARNMLSVIDGQPVVSNVINKDVLDRRTR